MDNSSQTHRLGADGERAARQYLTDKGYRIRHVNWRSHHLELDIVAQQGDELVVIEVKTRRNMVFTHPADAVTEQKIRRIVTAAQAYIYRYNIRMDVRFDVMALIPCPPDGFKIEHFENAFFSPVW